VSPQNIDIESYVWADGMDALLGVLLVAVGFALFIFLVDKSAKYITIIGLAILFIASLALIGMVVL
jgi:hypothetical protein